MSGSEIVVTFLGTGSAIPPNSKQQVSFSLRHQNGLVIFDCGEGTQYALRKLGIPTRKQVVISISHLHSDHFLGLPGLLSSFQLLGRTEEIIIVGPRGIRTTVKNLMVANYIKVEYKLTIVELKPGESFRGDGYVIDTIKAKHEANALSYIWQEDEVRGKVSNEKIRELDIPSGPLIGKLVSGQSIEVDGRVIEPEEVVGPSRRGRCVIYSGDTAYNPHLAELNVICDLLVHEATYPSELTELAKERSHTTTVQAARIAKELNVQRLVLTHLSPRIQDYKEEYKKVKAIFENSIFAKQGTEITIPYLYH